MAERDILIVEDNAVNLMILRAMLRKRGFEPIVARDGAGGVEAAVTLRPGLVLMDLQMPLMDGISAATEIRRRLGPDAPRIVAVTANVTEAVMAQCRDAQFDDVLGKPLIVDELFAMVAKHLGPG